MPERTASFMEAWPLEIVVDEFSLGGMRVRDGSAGGDACTAGWTVENSSGTTGITTAGHCEFIDEIEHPGIGTHSLTYQLEHRGEWGDVEWRTSNALEPAEFYSDADTVRNTTAVEARANISEDESVCQYGRSSDDRDCSLDVDIVSQDCTNDGVFNDRLVIMDGDTGIGGDSGGGWSLGNRAFGGHKGNCSDLGTPIREAFSVADLFDEAIGVDVRTQ